MTFLLLGLFLVLCFRQHSVFFVWISLSSLLNINHSDVSFVWFGPFNIPWYISMFSLNWLNICAMYTCNLATLFIMISSACAFHYICFVAGQHIEWSAKADYIDCSKGRNQKVRKQFTRLRTETNKLVIFIVPPLPALLIILFLFIVEKIFIKLLRAVVGVIEVFRALILTGLAQDVLVLLGQEGPNVQKRTNSWATRVKNT